MSAGKAFPTPNLIFADQPASQDTPALVDLEDSERTRERQYLDRTADAKDTATETDSFAPPWLAKRGAPTRTADFPQQRDLRHRDSSVEPFHIWAPDDRRLYNDLSYPWRCVCKITNPFGGKGSGALIGPRHVLTASHVVAWNTDRPELVQVHLAGNAAAGTAHVIVATAYTQIPNVNYTNVDEDYAVLVLDRPLGNQWGWLGTRVYDAGWDGDKLWASMGYAPDIGNWNYPCFQDRKSLDEDELDYGSGRAMKTDADCVGGQSGSPMFGFWDDGVFAVAVISGGSDGFPLGRNNWCAGGSDLTRLVKWTRDRHP